MPLSNEEIEAQLRAQSLSVHIAYRQMRALERIAEELVTLSNPLAPRDESFAADYQRGLHEFTDANPQKS